ncbi:hypothetical protein P7C70_g879, partial [Phenoliferia sp. Uapishka_3]
MGFFHEHEESDARAHSEVYNTQPTEEHKSNLFHLRALSLAQLTQGLGIAGAEVDKLFESKGLDFIDKEKVA